MRRDRKKRKPNQNNSILSLLVGGFFFLFFFFEFGCCRSIYCTHTHRAHTNHRERCWQFNIAASWVLTNKIGTRVITIFAARTLTNKEREQKNSTLTKSGYGIAASEKLHQNIVHSDFCFAHNSILVFSSILMWIHAMHCLITVSIDFWNSNMEKTKTETQNITTQ